MLVGCVRIQQWRDALLQWNASEYDNVHQVVLQPRQIWTPDVVLINAYVIDINITENRWTFLQHYPATLSGRRRMRICFADVFFVFLCFVLFFSVRQKYETTVLGNV